MKAKKHIAIVGSLALFLFILWSLQCLLVPKYMTGVIEGALIAEYYKEDKNHDVMFIGDCEVYENFSPIALWETYGITSYIRGSAQQLIWQSYYLLEETLKYEKPEVVVFNVLALKYDTPQKEAYNRMTLDGMKLSFTKLKAIRASMLKEESLIDYIFPLLRYHGRWKELNQEDLRYAFKKDKVSHNGYYMRVDVNPLEGNAPTPRRLADYTFGDNAYKYLDRIVALCKANGIELVLIKAPSVYPHWYDQWEEQIEVYAEKNELKYINFLEHLDEIDIDFTMDTYDQGLHLNLSGAEKLSRYFGGWLVENYELEDRRYDASLASKWDEKVAFYRKMEADQYQELETYGVIKSVGGNNE